MIVPSQRAVALALVAAPLALLLGVARPDGWLLGVAWALGIALLALLDGLLAPRIRKDDLRIEGPGAAEVGAIVRLSGTSASLAYAADISSPLDPLPSRLREGNTLTYTATRRGTARLSRIWARASGPLGLAFRQRTTTTDDSIRVLPDQA